MKKPLIRYHGDVWSVTVYCGKCCREDHGRHYKSLYECCMMIYCFNGLCAMTTHGYYLCYDCNPSNPWTKLSYDDNYLKKILTRLA
jgi:hypothetical protein